MTGAREASRPFILGLGGTPRAGSSTERALQVALDAAAAAGAETVLLGGEALMLPIYDPAVIDLPTPAARLVALVRRCDGLIVASPGYHGSMSGLIKNALDYVEALRGEPAPYLEGRAVGCIVCAHGWQATGTTLIALRSVVHALRGWPTPFGAAINSAQPLFDAEGGCTDAAVRAQLALVGRQVVEFAQMRRGAGVSLEPGGR